MMTKPRPIQSYYPPPHHDGYPDDPLNPPILPHLTALNHPHNHYRIHLQYRKDLALRQNICKARTGASFDQLE
jgi:hypothetical protein